jgi:hypothetical protein
MKFGLGGITNSLSLGADFAALQAVMFYFNSTNLPPIAKVLGTVSLQFASYEIIKRGLNSLPPSVKGIANTLLRAQILIAGVQLIGPITQLMGQLSSGGNPLALGGYGGSPTGSPGYQPLPLA